MIERLIERVAVLGALALFVLIGCASFLLHRCC